MLMMMDKLLKRIPSKTINTLTGGWKGSSLCGRLYLYRKYINSSGLVVNISIRIVDTFEKDHCKTSARYWRLRVKKEGIYFPREYDAFL